MILGAGAVPATEQVDCAKAADATYIVSPGFTPVVVEYCQKVGISIVPGCANPSDVEQTLSLGLTTVKFFPAEAPGGLRFI